MMIHTNAISQMEDIVTQLKPILIKKQKINDLKVIESYLEKIRNRETNILVCGEFKRGKSSFINAFLEQKICPVDVDIATSTVSIIKYGKTTKVTRQFGDLNNLQTETFDSLDKIPKYAKGSANSIDNTVLLIIEIPNEKLADGLVLIDTPGVGGLDPRHAFLTNYFLPKADIILFITDRDAPLTDAEITFFEKKIKPYAKQKAILVNKADRFTSPEDMAEWINNIHKKCGPATELSVIPVSSKLKLDYVNTKDRESLTESNFASVEELLATLTDDFKKRLLVELKDNIVHILTDIQNPLKAQIEQITLPDPNLIIRLENELSDLKAQKERLDNPNSQYRRNLLNLINNARSEVELKLQTDNILLSGDVLATLINNPLANGRPQWLLEQINNAIGSTAAELDRMIDSAFDQVIMIIGDDNKMSQNHSKFSFIVDADLTPAEKTFGTVAYNTARQALPGLGIFALGSIIATAVASVIAIPVIVPALAAMAFVGKGVVDASKATDKALALQKLTPQVHIALTHLKTYVNERFSEFNTQLLNSLQQGSKRIIDNMQSSIEDLTKLKSETQQQQQIKSKLLTEELKPIEQLLIISKAFLSNPFAKKAQETPAADNCSPDMKDNTVIV